MAEEEYKNNSETAKENQQTLPATKPKLSGEVQTVKKSGGRKFIELFVKADPRDVAKMCFHDIFIPKLIDIGYDALSKGYYMMFKGSAAPKSSSQDQPSYTKYYGDRSAKSVIPASLREEPKYKIREYDFETRGDAEVIMDILCDILQQNDRVTIAHYYDQIGKPVEDTDWNYGWYSLKGIRAERTWDGRWEIRFPPIKCVK